MTKSIINWEHFMCYLAGPIDFDPSGGSQWRSDWANELIQIGFKSSHILSPTKKPLNGTDFDLDNEAQLINEARSKGDYDELVQIMDKLAHIDLRMVDKSDLIIVRFPVDSNGKRIFTVGTIHEIVVARQERKPVMAVWDGGKINASGWLMWLIGHENVFSTFTELKDRLSQIAVGEVNYNVKDWLLFDFNKTHKTRRNSDVD